MVIDILITIQIQPDSTYIYGIIDGVSLIYQIPCQISGVVTQIQYSIYILLHIKRLECEIIHILPVAINPYRGRHKTF